MKIIEDIKEAISDYKTEDDLKVFRGVRGSHPFSNTLKSGDITVIDEGFMSPSPDKVVIERFIDDEGVLFEIDIPKVINVGSYMEDIVFFDSEYEFLIQPSTKFKVKDVITKEKTANKIRGGY